MSLAARVLPSNLRRSLGRQLDMHRFGAGYLEQLDWYDGARSRTSVGGEGRPVPWVTFPAFRMLDQIVLPTHKVFEYGCGGSSLWWSRKASVVASVEHNSEWASSVSARAPDNLSVTLREKGDQTPSEAQPLVDSFLSANPELPNAGDITNGMNCADFGAYAVEPVKYGKGHFDIFMIDGMARSLCAYVAADFIADKGIIVFDNSERQEYRPGFEELGRRGWKRIDFYGPGPVNYTEWCTSIFCRDLDWLPNDLTLPES